MDRHKLVEYYKQVLDRFSTVEPVLFRKELRKAFHRLDQDDRKALKDWFRSSCVCKLQPDRELIRVTVRKDGGYPLN